MPRRFPLCACGCGKAIKRPDSKYINAGHATRGKASWNKGLTKETDKRVAKYSRSLEGRIGSNTGRTFSNKHKEKLAVAKRKELNPNWNGGRCVMPGGYIYVHTPEHPHANVDGYVMEHRLVMEKQLGRYLTKKEIVHHKNENKIDNQIENLQLMTISNHVKFHMKKKYKSTVVKEINLLDNI